MPRLNDTSCFPNSAQYYVKTQLGKNLKKKVNLFCLELFNVSGAAWGRVLEGDKSGLGVTLRLFPS